MSVPLWIAMTTVAQWVYRKCASVWKLVVGVHLATPWLYNADSPAILSAEEAVAGSLGALLGAGDGATVTLVAGDTRLAAHRAVLAARSEWFSSLFQYDSSSEVMVPDVEGPVLRQLLAFCYTLRAPQLPAMAPQLLAAAARYSVYRLVARCEQHLAAQLTVENAAATAVLAERHRCPNLPMAASAFIRANIFQVMCTDGWADAVCTWPEEAVRVTRLLARPLSYPRSIPEEDRIRWLLRAAERGDVEDLRLLLAAGMDIETRAKWDEEDGEFYTPLHWAAEGGRLEAIQFLLEAGAEVDSRDLNSETPLHLAAGFGRAAAVRMLVAFSADPNARNYWGQTPLHRAAEGDHRDTVAALLEIGADRGAKNEDGDTPFDVAKRNGYCHVVNMLT